MFVYSECSSPGFLFFDNRKKFGLGFFKSVTKFLGDVVVVHGRIRDYWSSSASVNSKMGITESAMKSVVRAV